MTDFTEVSASQLDRAFRNLMLRRFPLPVTNAVLAEDGVFLAGGWDPATRKWWVDLEMPDGRTIRRELENPWED